MKKVSLLLLIHLFIAGFIFGQSEDFFIKKNAKGPYIEHKLGPKENFYSIGRLFAVHPKHIASFNGLDMKKGLSIGQLIMIPLTDTNFSQKANSGVPVYSDNKHIAGYLIAGELAQSGQQTTPMKEETVIVTKPDSSLKVTPTDLFQNKNKEVEQNTNTDIVKEEKKPVIKEEPKKQQPIVEVTKMPEDGFFKTDFEQQVKIYPTSKDETVTSGVFKITSGGKEAKYYALMDGVEPGTIIKVINPTNNKIVFAKVLGEMKGIRQNEGFGLRISDTAASALEISETDKFIVKVNY